MPAELLLLQLLSDFFIWKVAGPGSRSAVAESDLFASEIQVADQGHAFLLRSSSLSVCAFFSIEC